MSDPRIYQRAGAYTPMAMDRLDEEAAEYGPQDDVDDYLEVSLEHPGSLSNLPHDEPDAEPEYDDEFVCHNWDGDPVEG